MPPRLSLRATVLDTRDPGELARFYRDLLGWEIRDEDPTWVALHPADGGAGLSFQLEPLYEPPTWPAEAGTQQMQQHLDVLVDDLEAAVEHALALGARQAEWQPQDDVRVMVDPHGHPFCLFELGA